MEWTILLLLAPLVLIPVVLLYGFAGCSFRPGAAELDPPDPPTNLRVTATDTDSISLAWDYLDPPPFETTFEVLHNQADPPIATGLTDKAFTHTGLSEGTAHAYQVRAVRTLDHQTSAWVPEPPLMAMTRKFDVVFTTAGIQPNPSNGVNNSNATIVQRINAVTKTGIFMRITLRGIVNETTVLTAVTVSKAVPAAAPQPWDSANQPGPVTFSGAVAVTITGGGIAVSDKVSFTVDQGTDLLVAMNVDNGSGRILRRDLQGAVAYIGSNRAEAALMDRGAGYNTDNNHVYCIELIEVA